MLRDLNPGAAREPRRRTCDVSSRVSSPAFAASGQSAGQRRQDRLRRASKPALVKRFASDYSFRVSYTLGYVARQHVGRRRADQRLPGARRPPPRAERGADQLRSPAQPRRSAARRWCRGPSGIDRQLDRARAERLAASASSIRRPIPIATGSFTEPLPAGTYTGTRAESVSRPTSTSERNGAVGPGFFQLDMRLGYRLRTRTRPRRSISSPTSST